LKEKEKEKKDERSWMDLLLAMSYYSECEPKGMAMLVVCGVNQHSEARLCSVLCIPLGEGSSFPE